MKRRALGVAVFWGIVSWAGAQVTTGTVPVYVDSTSFDYSALSVNKMCCPPDIRDNGIPVPTINNFLAGDNVNITTNPLGTAAPNAASVRISVPSSAFGTTTPQNLQSVTDAGRTTTQTIQAAGLLSDNIVGGLRGLFTTSVMSSGTIQAGTLLMEGAARVLIPSRLTGTGLASVTSNDSLGTANVNVTTGAGLSLTGSNGSTVSGSATGGYNVDSHNQNTDVGSTSKLFTLYYTHRGSATDVIGIQLDGTLDGADARPAFVYDATLNGWKLYGDILANTAGDLILGDIGGNQVNFSVGTFSSDLVSLVDITATRDMIVGRDLSVGRNSTFSKNVVGNTWIWASRALMTAGDVLASGTITAQTALKEGSARVAIPSRITGTGQATVTSSDSAGTAIINVPTGAGLTTPSLQQVSDVGNSTTNQIFFNKSSGTAISVPTAAVFVGGLISGGSLSTSGNATAGTDVIANRNLAVAFDATVAGVLGVTRAIYSAGSAGTSTTMAVGTDLTVARDATVTRDLSVTRNSTLGINATSTNLMAAPHGIYSADLKTSGPLSVGGAATVTQGVTANTASITYDMIAGRVIGTSSTVMGGRYYDSTNGFAFGSIGTDSGTFAIAQTADMADGGTFALRFGDSGTDFVDWTYDADNARFLSLVAIVSTSDIGAAGNLYANTRVAAGALTPPSAGAYMQSPSYEGGYRTLSGTTTIADTDTFVELTGGTYTVTLPSASRAGRLLVIKKTSAITSTNIIAGTVDGSVNPTMTAVNASMVIFSNGTSWLKASGI